jgi:hypothetical protein
MRYQEDSLNIVTVAEIQERKIPGIQAFCHGSLGGGTSYRVKQVSPSVSFRVYSLGKNQGTS